MPKKKSEKCECCDEFDRLPRWNVCEHCRPYYWKAVRVESFDLDSGEDWEKAWKS